MPRERWELLFYVESEDKASLIRWDLSKIPKGVRDWAVQGVKGEASSQGNKCNGIPLRPKRGHAWSDGIMTAGMHGWGRVRKEQCGRDREESSQPQVRTSAFILWEDKKLGEGFKQRMTWQDFRFEWLTQLTVLRWFKGRSPKTSWKAIVRDNGIPQKP